MSIMISVHSKSSNNLHDAAKKGLKRGQKEAEAQKKNTNEEKKDNDSNQSLTVNLIRSPLPENKVDVKTETRK